jgi:hypothetical protein
VWGFQIIQALTALSVMVTAIYVVLTYRIASTNKQMVAIMQEQLATLDRPYVEVSAFLVPSSIIIYLRIKNTGKISAFNLRLRVEKDFYRYGRTRPENNLSQLNAFKRPIPTFPPGVELTFPLAQAFLIFGDNAREEITPRSFSIRAVYSYREKTISEDTIIDLNPYEETEPRRDPIVERMERIVKALRT